MQQVSGVIGIRGKRVRPESGSAALDWRQVGANGVAADPIALHHMILEGDRVELPRDFVSLILRPPEIWVPGMPLEKVGLCLRRNGSSRELLAPGVNQPDPGFLSELCPKVKAIRLARVWIRRSRKRHLRRWPRPLLIFQPRRGQADRLVKPRNKTMRKRHREECGALVGREVFSVHHKFVSFGFASKNGMIIEHQAGLVPAA